MKVTDEMVYAAQRARTARLAKGRGAGPEDGMREAVEAVLALIEPERVDIRISPRGLGGILIPPVTIEDIKVGTTHGIGPMKIDVERVR